MVYIYIKPKYNIFITVKYRLNSKVRNLGLTKTFLHKTSVLHF